MVFDAWDVFHPGQPPDLQTLSDQQQIDLLGVTCESKLNTFRPKDLETATNDPNAKRLDYIFTTEALIETIQVVLTERIPEHDINYSDHFGVAAVIHLPQEKHKTVGYIPQEVFSEIRKITVKYMEREERHRMLRLWHFYLSTALIVILHTAVWFAQRRPVIFLLMFVCTMCSWTGVLGGLISFVWGSWERRTLKEFSSEMELAGKVYAQTGVPAGPS